MEIKDINVTVERLEDVRGGQTINVRNAGFQLGGNVAGSRASGWGVGNSTSSGVSQVAGQSMTQGTIINAAELSSYTHTIDASVVGGFGFGFPLRSAG